MRTGIKIKPERAGILLAGAVIVLGGLAAYAGSFSGAMLYDDFDSIVYNPAVQHLWPWTASPGVAKGGLTVSGRPVLQFSLAVNHALGENRVWGYHAANLAIHLLAGLTLFGILRRTLSRVATRESARRAVRRSLGEGGSRGQGGPGSARANDPTALAFVIALLWTLHPLQTEAVTYIVQRAESLMGLFYLLTLYCFIRGAGEHKSAQPSFAKPSAGEEAARRASFCWLGLSWLACLFGMATKEVMVTAPLMVLLYDRTFVGGTFREAWRRRRWFYTALASTWLPLAYLVASLGGNRGGTAGFGVAVSGWAYELTQFKAVARYLWLSFWPHPLVFEYGTFWVRGGGEVLPYVLPVLLLLAATVWALLRPINADGHGAISAARGDGRNWRAVGFLGAWFFGILAPTSLMPGTMQMIVEHRMYLPLAGVITALVLGWGALCEQARLAAPARLVALVAIAIAFGCLTVRRNETYRSAAALWGDTVAKRPDNALAVYNLGVALNQAGRFREASGQFARAVQLRPDLAAARYDLGFALFQMGRTADAVACYEEGLRLEPRSFMAHNSLGVALASLGRTAEATAQYEEALRLEPGYARAHDNLGNALLRMNRLPEAVAQYREAVRLDPSSAVAHYNLANSLLRVGLPAEAVAQFEAVLRLRPGDPAVRASLNLARQAAAKGSGR